MYHLHSLDSYHGPRDERGLIPVELARDLLSPGGRALTGRNGKPKSTDEALADQWAALLSLTDVSEFRAAAARLNGLRFRKVNAEELGLRYGADLLPWISEFVVQGCLLDNGWPLANALCGCEHDEAFELVWSLVSVDTPHGGQPDASANQLVMQWLWAFPSLGFFLLGKKVQGADPRATLILRSLAQCHPTSVFRFLAWGHGDDEARRVFELAKVTTAPDRSGIANILDFAAANSETWPLFLTQEPETAYHGLRLLVLRSARNGNWALVFERVQGSSERNAVVMRFVASSWPLPPKSWASRELGLFAVALGEDQVEIHGPHGNLSIQRDQLASDAFGSGWHCSPNLKDEQYSLLVRAYLSANPDAFWGNVESIQRELGLDAEHELFLVSQAFEHHVSLGTSTDAATSAKPPSASPVFQSLIDAIVSGDAARF